MPNKLIFANVINSYLPEPHASLLNGILFGISLKTTPLFYQKLKMVGLLHIVVLSGINITILSSVISQITIFLGKQISILITILTIIIFIIFIGAEAPILRAGFMGIFTLVAVLLGRKSSSLWLLFLSLLPVSILHLFYPEKITFLSTLLSYGATLGIILFSPYKKTQPKNFYDKIKIAINKELQPSLAAQLFTAPIIFIYFKQISLVAPLSNLLTAPFIPPLMVFGFLTAIFGKIHYPLGLPFSFICFSILEYLIFVINFLSQIPYVFFQF